MQEVLSKMTPNGKVRLYLPQREYIDYLKGIQPIEGAVVVKPDYIEPDRVFAVQLMSNIRYGREEEEVMECKMAKEICLASVALNDTRPPEKLSKMQTNLKRTHGETCYPFRMEWPRDAAASLFIEQPPGAKGEACGIRHYIEVFCLYKGDKPHKRSSIRLDLSLIQLPGMSETDSSGIVIPPAVAINHPVFLSPGNVQLEVCLEKTIIYDEEPLIIHVTIANNSNQAIKKMKTKLMQFYTVTILKGEKKIEITGSQTTDGFPIAPGGSLSQTVTLFPRVPIGPAQDGVAVRKLTSKSVNTMLASSTLYADSENLQDKFGFIISYRVIIKLSLVSSPVLPKVVAKVPIYIMARKPSNINLTEEAVSDTASIGSQEDFMELRQRKLNATPKVQRASPMSQIPKSQIPKREKSPVPKSQIPLRSRSSSRPAERRSAVMVDQHPV